MPITTIPESKISWVLWLGVVMNPCLLTVAGLNLVGFNIQLNKNAKNDFNLSFSTFASQIIRLLRKVPWTLLRKYYSFVLGKEGDNHRMRRRICLFLLLELPQ
jgi:hypothetical protein